MIKDFVSRFEKRKGELRGVFLAQEPESYLDIVKQTVRILGDEDEYETIDSTRIHKIDDGDYQGNLLYVIAANNYQPSKYWYVFVSYGSCSGCDTLQGIQSDSYLDDCSTQENVEKRADEYMILALHIVQGLKRMASPYSYENEETPEVADGAE